MLVTVATLGAVRYPSTYKQHREVSVHVSTEDSGYITSTDNTRTGRIDVVTTGEGDANGESINDTRSTELCTERRISDASQDDTAASANVDEDAPSSTAYVQACTDAAVVPRKPLISYLPGW